MSRQKSKKRKSADFQIEVFGGNQYPSLEAAQEAALPFLSASLLTVLRDLMEKGVVIRRADGKIVPNPQQKQ